MNLLAFVGVITFKVGVPGPAVAQLGALYLQIVGPFYVCFGLGFGLFFARQRAGASLPRR